MPIVSLSFFLILSVFTAGVFTFLGKKITSKYFPKISWLFQGSFPFFALSLLFFFVFDTFFLLQVPESTTFVIASKIVWIALIAQAFTSFFFLLTKNSSVRWGIFFISWTSVALYRTGILAPILHLLGQIKLQIGPNQLSLLSMLKAIVASALLIWIANLFCRYLEKELEGHKHLQPSLKLIFIKLIKTIFISFAIYFGLSLLGIDLSALSFFAGALGVGIAFGLQNILSNFFCGFILLFDRSIKPGDVISIQDGKIYGVVHKLNARYVSVKTREGKEHLIPNQQIITNKLENWSYSDPYIRIEIPFKVSVHSNPSTIEKLLTTIALSTKRVLDTPAPSVRFTELTANSLEVKLYLWIKDPQNGLSGIRSEIIIKAWKAFQEEKITIPAPAVEIQAPLPSK